MTAPLHCRHANAGFTLVEMGIVLLIVGLLLAGTMMSLSTQDDLKRIARTDERLAEVREALIGFAIVNGRLPRPATSLVNGNERAVCATELDCTGYIPWALLGLQRTDGYDNLIRYSVTPAFANAAFTLATLPSKLVTSRDAAGLVTYLAGNVPCTLNNGCTPAVIYSTGRRNWGVNLDGIALGDTSTTNTDEDANNAATVSFMSRDNSESTTLAGGEFDDRVIWLPAVLLSGRMVQAGRLP
ncbi:MAG: prepilin-type N-terminal cleavage/methylation domain-containing protein [Burkholderiales bacterium]|jgi:prepilin-type N-terminal cleavage/methylation domain-containing protein